MLLIVLLVVFVVVMLIWFLSLVGTLPGTTTAGRGDWLAWIAVAVLGVVVFLVGAGVLVVERVPVR